MSTRQKAGIIKHRDFNLQEMNSVLFPWILACICKHLYSSYLEPLRTHAPNKLTPNTEIHSHKVSSLYSIQPSVEIFTYIEISIIKPLLLLQQLYSINIIQTPQPPPPQTTGKKRRKLKEVKGETKEKGYMGQHGPIHLCYSSILVSLISCCIILLNARYLLNSSDVIPLRFLLLICWFHQILEHQISDCSISGSSNIRLFNFRFIKY